MIEYSASAIIIVSSNPFVGPLPRIKISFSYYQDKLMNYCLQQKWQHFYPNQDLEMKVNENQIQYHIWNNDIYLDHLL